MLPVKDAEPAALVAEGRDMESGNLREESGDLINESESPRKESGDRVNKSGDFISRSGSVRKKSEDLRNESGSLSMKGENLRIVPALFRKREGRAGRGSRRGSG